MYSTFKPDLPTAVPVLSLKCTHHLLDVAVVVGVDYGVDLGELMVVGLLDLESVAGTHWQRRMRNSHDFQMVTYWLDDYLVNL